MTTKPEDATWIGPWEEGQQIFDGQSWTIEHTTHNGRPYPITIAVIGKQYDDGRVQRRIVINLLGDPITTAEARQVIEALTEAAASVGHRKRGGGPGVMGDCGGSGTLSASPGTRAVSFTSI